MNLKGAGFLPLFAILLFFPSAWCEKLVEVTAPIIKFRVLPSATSDSKGFAHKGQRLVVDGENGQWFQVRLYNRDVVWIPKEAVNILQSTDTAPAASTAAAAPAKPSESTVVKRLLAAAGSPAARPQPHQPPSQPQVPGAPATAPAAGTAAAPSPQEGLPTGMPAPLASAQPPASQPPPVHVPAPVQIPRKAYKAIRKTGTWQSQFSRISETESGKDLLFFQVSDNDAPVYSATGAAAVILTKAKKGDFFPVMEEAGAWCKIALQDTIGWIESSKGTVVAAPKLGFFEEYQIYIIIGAAAVLLVIAIVFFVVFRQSARGKNLKSHLFHTLIFAKMPPQINCVVSGKTMSLEKYLSAVGFSFKIVHALSGAQKIITKQQPDVVFIDWNISDDIAGTIELLFTGYGDKKPPLAIFYNVPDPSDVPMIPVMLQAYHLGRSFTDHDISKLITPIMLSRTTQKTAASSALEGDIAEGNLPEIMQFIETGKKTGCLLVEGEKPLGMIFFGQGRIIHAAAAENIAGKDAINFLLKLKQGKFKFLLDKKPKISDLNLSTLEVLMEWSKAEDEAHRG